MSWRTMDERGLRVPDDHHVEARAGHYRRIDVGTLNRRIAVETQTHRFLLTYESLDLRERHATQGRQVIMPWEQVFEALVAWRDRAATLDAQRVREEALALIASGQLSKSEARNVARRAMSRTPNR